VDAQVTYAIGQETKTIDLKDQPSYFLRLTADEATNFRAVSVNGPVSASFVKREAGDVPATNGQLSLKREYRQDGKPVKEWREGNLVTVSLSASWDAKAQDGCYTLRDRLPANMLPVVNIGFNRFQNQPLWYPYDTSGNEVSFVVCKQDKPLTLDYLARVITIGTYKAEGALLQSMETPSLAAVSAPQTIEVK